MTAANVETDKVDLVHQVEQTVLHKDDDHEEHEEHKEEETHEGEHKHESETKVEASHEAESHHATGTAFSSSTTSSSSSSTTTSVISSSSTSASSSSSSSSNGADMSRATSSSSSSSSSHAADTASSTTDAASAATKSSDELKKKMEKESAEKKAEQIKKQVTHTLIPIPYNSTFVNGSRPLPKKNTPIPDGWEDSSLVKQISTYSRKFLRDINDPKQKNKRFLVGKSMYMEGGFTFDEQPVILQESAPHMTGVNVVQRNYNTQEKADLWRRFNNEEFKDGFKDVMFNGNSSKDFSSVTDVIKGRNVRIRLNNRNTKSLQQLASEQTDKILEKTLNPVKQVIFTKDRVNDITFDDHNSDTANQKRLTGIDGMKVNLDMVNEKAKESAQRSQYAKKDMSKKSIKEQALYDYKPSYYGNQYA